MTLCISLGVTSDILLTVNITIINNQDCSVYLAGNTSTRPVLKNKLKRALEFGVNQQLLCSTGHKNETDDANIYSGPCEGDSGGPLYIKYGKEDETRQRQTVEGIVSGGVGCGKNIPSWYTRVMFFLFFL